MKDLHCLAWGVRGHYRHYKSGKVAYIKPHVRGKEKRIVSGKGICFASPKYSKPTTRVS